MEHPSPFIDFIFRRQFDLTNTENWSHSIPFYYLHGSLHLFREDNITKKLTANGRNILDRLDETMTMGRTPLFVSEGTSEQKLQTITSNDYLNFCYYKLKNISRSITILGHSLNDHDKHIINAINTSQVESIAYGIFLGDIPNERHIQYECARIRKLFSNKEVTFFN